MIHRFRILCAGASVVVLAGSALVADEGMWRIDQLPYAAIQREYGVRLTPDDLARVQGAVVRLQSPGGGGTGTFASADGLILTNHHVALDCIRTSALADENQSSADNLIETGFTAASRTGELPCKRFRAQIERSARDVTAQLNAGVTPGMPIEDVQRVRLAARSDLERQCAAERGDDYTCAVVDFNSGARSLLIVYEDFRDLRLVYAPEKQLGYFGGDEMNFRFPRYVSDISILRAYQGADGSHGEYDTAHVPVKPASFLRVTMDGVTEGDFTLVVGNPGNTNRYRMSYSARYNLLKGIPDQIRDLETELELLRHYASEKPENQVLLQSRIFGLANTLKYQQDVLAALRSTNIVEDRLERERQFSAFLASRPDLAREFDEVLARQAAVYANDVEANADLDAALGWFGRSELVSYALGLYQFAEARAQASDRDRLPQFQERNWPNVRAALLDDEPILAPLEEDVLAIAFETALALPAGQAIPAVRDLGSRLGSTDPRVLAKAVAGGSTVASVATRERLADGAPAAFRESSDPAVRFAVALEPGFADQRRRVAVLNEKIFQNRSQFARGLVAWKGTELYPDANFTLRASYGKVAGYRNRAGEAVPFTTRLGGLFALADERGNQGDYAVPPKVMAWRRGMEDAAFRARYADMPVDFVSTNDITGGNSGSATLNARLQIVGLIFDGNEEAMASDWTYTEVAGRALSTDIRFALTIARDVHGAGWIVDELLGAPPARAAADAPAIDAAFAAFWRASTPAEAARGAEAIASSGVSFDEALERLRRGRPYGADVPRGVVRRSHQIDGVAFPYTLDVPASYDPSRAWPVRVQLHGGISRPDGSVRGDGSIGSLAGAGQIYVLPVGWSNAVWWSESQVRNLDAILDDLKRRYNVDENRVVLAGVSDGATATYYFAMRDTTPFAAFLPLNGFIKVLANESLDLRAEMFPTNLRNKPWFVVNGGQDPLYPTAAVEPYLMHFKAGGVELDYHPQPTAAHNTRWWPEVKDSFEAFAAAHPRDPNPPHLTWETDVSGASNRAHWLVIDRLAPRVAAEPLADLNDVVSGRELNFGVTNSGMRVLEVVAGSNADTLGLRPGDLVQRVNGRALPPGVDLLDIVGLTGDGARLVLSVDRGGASVDLAGTYRPTPMPRVSRIFEHSRPSGRVDLVREGNVVHATTRGVAAFTLLLSPDVFDFSHPIVVVANGRTVFDGLVTPSVETLAKWAARDNDRTMLYAAELRLIM